MTEFQIGYMNLHSDVGINFLMNRMADAIPADKLISLGAEISDLASCVDIMLASAKHAELEEEHTQAATLYRGAEFYMTREHPEKLTAYNKFLHCIDLAFPQIAPLRKQVPYEGGFLPVIDVPAIGEQRDIIVAHSGFDGFMEELYPVALTLSAAGYRVVLFEGPGQGAALRHHQLAMPYDWETPYSAILDHLKIESCTALGLSLGGYLAPRAAAFEPRIKKLIIWGAMYDFAACFARNLGSFWNGLHEQTEAGNREAVNTLLNQLSTASPQANWGIAHGMHVCGATDPFEFITWLLNMNLINESELIKQDTLIIMGSLDHLVPIEQMYQQAAALKQARSVATRMITAQDHGAQHCQIGNPELVTHEILRWLDGMAFRDTQLVQHSIS